MIHCPKLIHEFGNGDKRIDIFNSQIGITQKPKFCDIFFTKIIFSADRSLDSRFLKTLHKNFSKENCYTARFPYAGDHIELNQSTSPTLILNTDIDICLKFLVLCLGCVTAVAISIIMMAIALHTLMKVEGKQRRI